MPGPFVHYTLDQIIRLWEGDATVYKFIAAEMGASPGTVCNQRTKVRKDCKTLQDVIDWYNSPKRPWNRPPPEPKVKAPRPPKVEKPKKIGRPKADPLPDKVRFGGYLMPRPKPSRDKYIVLTVEEWISELKGETKYTLNLDMKAKRKWAQFKQEDSSEEGPSNSGSNSSAG